MAELFSARWLVVLGIITWLPFAYVLALVLAGDATAASLDMAAIYGGALLVFLAGVRFGAALMSGANVPVSIRLTPLLGLVGLAALFIPTQAALALLVAGYGGQGAVDVWAGHSGRLPQSYVMGRTVMTWMCTLTLLAIVVLNGLV